MSAEYRFTPESPRVQPVRLVEYVAPLDHYTFLEGKKQQTYTLEFDLDAYQKLRVLKDTDPDTYMQQKEALDATTSFNLVTTLAERLNAAVSRRIDLIGSDGIMRDAFQNRPLIEWYEQGRLARLEQGASPHDQKREKAEIIGQEKLQAFFADAPVGSMAFFLSRPGTEFQPSSAEDDHSIYKHNFIDISYKSSGDEITVMRCMSGLSLDDALERVRFLKPDYQLSETPDDVELLEHPIMLQPDESFITDPDQLHAYLHESLTDALSEEEFTLVKNACMPYIRRYLSFIHDATTVTEPLGRAFNAILNKADEVVSELVSADISRLTKYATDSGAVATRAEALLIGLQPVRTVDTGCGFSGGFTIGSSSYGSSLSVLEFSGFGLSQETDQYGSLHFDCPSCKRRNTRQRGILIPNCQHCGANVRCDTDDSEKKKKQAAEKARKEQERLDDERTQQMIAEQQAKKQKSKEVSLWEILFQHAAQPKKKE